MVVNNHFQKHKKFCKTIRKGSQQQLSKPQPMRLLFNNKLCEVSWVMQDTEQPSTLRVWSVPVWKEQIFQAPLTTLCFINSLQSLLARSRLSALQGGSFWPYVYCMLCIVYYLLFIVHCLNTGETDSKQKRLTIAEINEKLLYEKDREYVTN